MSPSGTTVELDLGAERFWSRMGRGHLAEYCVLEGVFEDIGAFSPYGWASSTRCRLAGPTREGYSSTIELRFNTILYEVNA